MRPATLRLLPALMVCLFVTVACDSGQKPSPPAVAAPAASTPAVIASTPAPPAVQAPSPVLPTTTGKPAAPQSVAPETITIDPSYPTPPVMESFDGEPQLSLFPRTGKNRPDDGDLQGMGYWQAFIEHMQRSSGMQPGSGRDAGNGWLIHGIKGLDSIAFFSPLAVKPRTTYEVAFDVKGDLPKGVSAGIGIVEYNQFLWISDQFTAAQNKQYKTAVHPGAQITGNKDWTHKTFTFTTTPRARMIHLILFHDGPTDRQKPAVFDNISIREHSAKQGR